MTRALMLLLILLEARLPLNVLKGRFFIRKCFYTKTMLVDPLVSRQMTFAGNIRNCAVS
jgi:hypothetical protein